MIKTTTRQINDYFPIYPRRTQVNITGDTSECLLAYPGFLPKPAPKHIGLASHERSYHFSETVLSSTISAPLPPFLYIVLDYSSCSLPSPELLNSLSPLSPNKRISAPPFPRRCGSPLLFPNAKTRELIPYNEPNFPLGAEAPGANGNTIE